MQVQRSAEQVVVAIGEGEIPRFVARRISGLVSADRGRRDPPGGVAGHRLVIAVAFKLEDVGHELEPLVGGEGVADSGEQAPAHRVHDVALGRIDHHRAVRAVVKEIVALESGADHEIERADCPPRQRGSAIVEAVLLEIIRADFGADAAQPVAIARRPHRHIVDHAAGCAEALDGVRAENHFHTLHESRIDREAAPFPVTQRRRLRDSVH